MRVLDPRTGLTHEVGATTRVHLSWVDGEPMLAPLPPPPRVHVARDPGDEREDGADDRETD